MDCKYCKSKMEYSEGDSEETCYGDITEVYICNCGASCDIHIPYNYDYPTSKIWFNKDGEEDCNECE